MNLKDIVDIMKRHEVHIKLWSDSKYAPPQYGVFKSSYASVAKEIVKLIENEKK